MATDTASRPIEAVPSRLRGHIFHCVLNDTQYTFRVLCLRGSLFIYIGAAGSETFGEMAMAMPQETGGGAVASTIYGEQLGSSEDMAKGLAEKLHKHVFVSCNVPVEQEVRPALMRRFIEEVNNHPEALEIEAEG